LCKSDKNNVNYSEQQKSAKKCPKSTFQTLLWRRLGYLAKPLRTTGLTPPEGSKDVIILEVHQQLPGAGFDTTKAPLAAGFTGLCGPPATL